MAFHLYGLGPIRTTGHRQVKVFNADNLDKQATALFSLFICLSHKRLVLINGRRSLVHVAWLARERRNRSGNGFLLRDGAGHLHTRSASLAIPGNCCPCLLAGFARRRTSRTSTARIDSILVRGEGRLLFISVASNDNLGVLSHEVTSLLAMMKIVSRRF
jgi:hypothetical protein